jgi:integrase
MPAHLIKRADCGGTYYLVDGELTKSLKTKTKRYAEALLREYQDGKYRLAPVPTVGAYYERWIERKIEPLCRRAQIRDYRQAFKKHILPRFKDTSLLEIRTGDLSDFQVELLRKGLKVKSARNIIDASFRACYRDARAEIDELAGKDPFMDLRWPKVRREPPDPLTAEERDKVIAYFSEQEPFYYPFVRFQFETGMRPSESTALTWHDLNETASTVRIAKSRNLNTENNTKTSKSYRTIIIVRELMELLQCMRHPWSKDTDHIFLNKHGAPLTSDHFRGDYWNRVLDALGIRKRGFYACRHTFITEMVKKGYNLKAIAQYAGTSTTMIEDNYCGELNLDPNDPTIFQRSSEKALSSLASPTGFEPVSPA